MNKNNEEGVFVIESCVRVSFVYLVLRLEGIYNRLEVFVNGSEVRVVCF